MCIEAVRVQMRSWSMSMRARQLVRFAARDISSDGAAGEAVSAQSIDGEVARFDGEAMEVENVGAECVQRLAGDIGDTPALATDQMDMALVGEVVHSRPVPDVEMFEHAEFFESVERPIDGRHGDLRMRELDAGSDFLGGGVLVLVAFEQHRDDGSSGRRDSTAVLTEARKNCFHPIRSGGRLRRDVHADTSLLPAVRRR